jgi:uncharacterized membrane protein
MKNVLALVGLLLGGFGVALLFGAPEGKAARIGIAAVFALTAIGHFVKTDEMTAMLPSTMPARRPTVIISGFLELMFAVGILLPALVKSTGLAICVFLVLVTPANVYSALKKIDFGGHRAGPRYLLVRIPLQLLLLVWTYWFAIRPGGSPLQAP